MCNLNITACAELHAAFPERWVFKILQGRTPQSLEKPPRGQATWPGAQEAAGTLLLSLLGRLLLASILGQVGLLLLFKKVCLDASALTLQHQVTDRSG